MNAIGNAIAAVEGRIQQLQELHASLVKAVPLLSDVPLPPTQVEIAAPSPATARRMVKSLKKTQRQRAAARSAALETVIPPKRKYTKRKLGERPSLGASATGPKVPPAQSTQALLDGKATSLGGAMKVFIRKQTKFPGADLLAFLEGDADYAKLLEQSSSSAIPGNLAYWTNQGYLERAGGPTAAESTFTVTGAGKEWFSK